MRQTLLFVLLLCGISHLSLANNGGDILQESIFNTTSMAKRIDAVKFTYVKTPTLQIQGGLGCAFGDNLGQGPSLIIRYNPMYRVGQQVGLNATVEFEYSYLAANKVHNLTGRVGTNVVAFVEGNLSRRLFNVKQDGSLPLVLVDPQLLVGCVASKFSNNDKVLVGGFWDFSLNFYFRGKEKAKNHLAPVSCFIGFGMDLYANGFITPQNPELTNTFMDPKQFGVARARVGISANFGGNKKVPKHPLPSWQGE